MQVNIFKSTNGRSVLPCLWGFAAAVALDRIIDIEKLFFLIVVIITVVGASSVRPWVAVR
jgi:hypothetical protein